MTRRGVGVTPTRSTLAPRWADAARIAPSVDHELVLSMLQHPTDGWRWGRFVQVYPAGNSEYADACARYRNLLADESSYSSMTIEDLLDANVLPAQTVAGFRNRYVVDNPSR